MKKLNIRPAIVLALCLMLCTTIPLASFAQDARTIVKKSEEKLRGIQSSQAEMTMTIVRPDWTREMKLKSWSKGDDYALILVTAPARDKGTTNLKIKKEVWNWMPSIERTIKLPPSMMNQSWLGSDFTNDDLVRGNTLSDDYSHELLGDSAVAGLNCYKISLIPNEDAAVVWGKILLWIDKKEYLQMRAEFYDEDEYLINVMQASKIVEMGGKTIAARLEMIPVEEEGKKTIMEYNSLIFDKPISERFFTVQNMKRVR